MRWEVEILFRALKSVGHLGPLRSASLPVIHTFIDASLLAVILAQDISAQMRQLRPKVEPSLYRVTTRLPGDLPNIIDKLRTRTLRETRIAFEAALW